MSDSVFDVNEIAAVMVSAPCKHGSEWHLECAAAAVVAWLDERLIPAGMLGFPIQHLSNATGGNLPTTEYVAVYRIVQPEDQHG